MLLNERILAPCSQRSSVWTQQIKLLKEPNHYHNSVLVTREMQDGEFVLWVNGSEWASLFAWFAS